MANYTYFQPYTFPIDQVGQNITVIAGELEEGTPVGEEVGSFTVASGGSGIVELTVQDNEITKLYFVRDNDQRIITSGVFDPREIDALNIQLIADAILDTLRGEGDIILNPEILDENDNGVSNAVVTIRKINSLDIPESSTYRKGLTDSSGRIRFGDLFGFNLLPGKYLLTIQKDGYQPFPPQVINLSVDYSPVYSLLTIEPDVSDDSDMALVICDSRNFCDQPIKNIIFTFQVVSNDIVIIDKAFEPREPISVITDNTGKTMIKIKPSNSLPDGARYLCTIKSTVGRAIRNSRFYIDVPLGTNNLFDLMVNDEELS